MNAKLFVGLFAAAALGGIVAIQVDRWTDRPQPLIQVVDRSPATGVSGRALPVPTDFTAAAKRLLPSVVSIDTVGVGSDFFGFQRRVADTGSGIIFSSDGIIVTNAHVVGEGVTNITVHLADGRSYPAEVRGRDPISDLAVLRIKAKNLAPADLGASSDLEVGQWVIAVGNPLGQSHTLSVGVVSSLGRNISTNQQGVLLNAIQTDAAINPGNSGGALANAQGQVVGINSAIMSGNDRTSIGIGFAIPIDRARPIIQDLIEFGRARYGVTGFNIHPDPGLVQFGRIRQMYVSQYGAEPPVTGEIVTEVKEGSPASRIGLQPYDVITKLNDVELKERFDFVKFMAERRPGDKVRITYWSKGKTETKEIVLVDVNEI